MSFNSYTEKIIILLSRLVEWYVSYPDGQFSLFFSYFFHYTAIICLFRHFKTETGDILQINGILMKKTFTNETNLIQLIYIIGSISQNYDMRKKMQNICQYAGAQIRYYRKLRGYTLSELANRINKSVSTLSKYEGGTISVDLLTLSEIAVSLEVTIEQLLPPAHQNAPARENGAGLSLDPRHFFAHRDVYYMYFLFSPSRNAANMGVTVNAIEIKRNENAPDEAYLYCDCSEPETNYKCCKFVYHGTVLYYDFIVYFLLENMYHVGCHDYICAKVPFTHTNTTTGLYTGVSESLRNPGATKVIISKSLINITEDTVKELTLNDKDTIYDFKNRNALIVK